MPGCNIDLSGLRWGSHRRGDMAEDEFVERKSTIRIGDQDCVVGFVRRSGARGAICIHMMETDSEGQKKQWSNPRILELLEERRKIFCELLDLSVERLKEFGSTIEDPISTGCTLNLGLSLQLC